MDNKLTSKTAFDRAAMGDWAEHKNGISLLNSEIIAKNDVTIVGDYHFSSGSKYRDFFSDKNLRGFAAAGTTDIFVEIPVELENIKDSLHDWKISKSKFIDIVDEKTYAATGVSDTRSMMNDVANMVLNAKYHGIDVHFSQVSFTPEQKENLLSIAVKNADIIDSKYPDKMNEINQYLLDSGVSDMGRIELIEAVSLENGLSSMTLNKDLIDPFREELGIDQINILEQKIGNLKGYQSESNAIQSEFNKTVFEYRMGSDDRLADLIDQKNNGKALVVHGAAHGAFSNNDLDDILSSKGHSVARINLTYNEQDKSILSGSKYLPLNDPSEIFYDPKRNRLEAIDLNNNGILEGGPAIQQPIARTVMQP